MGQCRDILQCTMLGSGDNHSIAIVDGDGESKCNKIGCRYSSMKLNMWWYGEEVPASDPFLAHSF